MWDSESAYDIHSTGLRCHHMGGMRSTRVLKVAHHPAGVAASPAVKTTVNHPASTQSVRRDTFLQWPDVNKASDEASHAVDNPSLTSRGLDFGTSLTTYSPRNCRGRICGRRKRREKEVESVGHKERWRIEEGRIREL